MCTRIYTYIQFIRVYLYTLTYMCTCECAHKMNFEIHGPRSVHDYIHVLYIFVYMYTDTDVFGCICRDLCICVDIYIFGYTYTHRNVCASVYVDDQKIT